MGFTDTLAPHIAATAAVVVMYIIVGYWVASSDRSRWKHKRIILNPLKLASGNNRSTSLSTLQMLFFTVIVLWLSLYWCVNVRGLVKLQGDLGILLGIAGVGTFVGKATDRRRLMLSEVNFAWIKNKKWIEKDLNKGRYEGRKPKLSDLVTTDGKFDIARFQAVGFSFGDWRGTSYRRDRCKCRRMVKLFPLRLEKPT